MDAIPEDAYVPRNQMKRRITVGIAEDIDPFPLDHKHVSALDKAEALIYHCDFCPYLDLKDLLNGLLAHPTPENKKQFVYLFTTYYGLNTAGLTNQFNTLYFRILFSGNVINNGRPDLAGILTKLSTIKNKRGFETVQFSFVSKLVAMREESSPIYDRHVRSFLSLKEIKPDTVERRVKLFVNTISRIQTSYQEWAKNQRVHLILDKLKKRDTRLQLRNAVRLIDFLVWKVGNQKLLRG